MGQVRGQVVPSWLCPSATAETVPAVQHRRQSRSRQLTKTAGRLCGPDLLPAEEDIRGDTAAAVSNRTACQQHCIVDGIDRSTLVYIYIYLYNVLGGVFGHGQSGEPSGPPKRPPRWTPGPLEPPFGPPSWTSCATLTPIGLQIASNCSPSALQDLSRRSRTSKIINFTM